MCLLPPPSMATPLASDSCLSFSWRGQNLDKHISSRDATTSHSNTHTLREGNIEINSEGPAVTFLSFSVFSISLNQRFSRIFASGSSAAGSSQDTWTATQTGSDTQSHKACPGGNFPGDEVGWQKNTPRNLLESAIGRRGVNTLQRVKRNRGPARVRNA